MRSYYRIMLGQRSMYADECIAGNFIGADFGIQQDLSGQLPDVWRDFNKAFIPVFMELHPENTSKVSAGLACGALWTVSKGILRGDIVLCPNGQGQYYVGEVIGDYTYVPDGILPHRRPVQWQNALIDRAEMSDGLRNSTGSIGTVSNITKHSEELEKLLHGESAVRIIATDESIEDPAAFAMEKHLEDFLIRNWKRSELGRDYVIFEEAGELVGQQYPTDTGPIDILAISKDRKTLLVVELKKGRASDVVVGQILRYMGYVQEELLENGQRVKGVIIALEDDQRLKRALAMVNNIEFYRYEISFKLVKASS